jgi:Tol biopolymer transport system component
MAVRAGSEPGDIWVRDLVRGVTSRFTFTDRLDQTPIWSPEGDRIAFSIVREGQRDIAVKPVGGSEPNSRPRSQRPASLLLVAGRALPPLLRPSSREFLGHMGSPLEGEDREPRPFLDSPFSETRARFSPDGRWVVYDSNESGRQEIYVQAFPGPGRKWQISTSGGSDPRWSPKGDALYYLGPGLNMMRVTVQTPETRSRPGFQRPCSPRASDPSRSITAISSTPRVAASSCSARFAKRRRRPQPSSSTGTPSSTDREARRPTATVEGSSGEIHRRALKTTCSLRDDHARTSLFTG